MRQTRARELRPAATCPETATYTEGAEGADRGAATVVVAFAVAMLMLIAGSVFMIGAVASARHRADSAADLSALAAAASWPWGEEIACDQAQWVVERMRMRLDECRMNGQAVHVVVIAPVSGLGQITARATAGPVGADESG